MYISHLLREIIFIGIIARFAHTQDHMYDQDFNTQEADEEEEVLKTTTTVSTTRSSPPPFCARVLDNARRCVKKDYVFVDNYMYLPRRDMIVLWCDSLKKTIDCESALQERCPNVTLPRLAGHKLAWYNLCSNSAYVDEYMKTGDCISLIEDNYRACFDIYKVAIKDQLKNKAKQSLTHFETHFHLCCAKASFRRCTFDLLTLNCKPCEVKTIQSMGIATSDAEFDQNCNVGVDYAKCPGGDPRPTSKPLEELPYVTLAAAASGAALLDYAAWLLAISLASVL